MTTNPPVASAETPPQPEVNAVPHENPLPPAARITHYVTKYGVIGLLALLLLATTIFTDGFWSGDNLKNILTQNAPIALVSIGMTFVIISGVFDLSVGAIFAAGAVVYAKLSGSMPLIDAAILTLLVGVGAGLINGIIVTRLNVDPFIGTIGTGGAFAGLVLVYTNSQPILVEDEGFRGLGLGHILGIPAPVVVAGIAFLIGGLLLSRTVFGRYIYASGGNPEAARLAGIPVDGVRVIAYILVALGAIAGGMITASQLSIGQPSLGVNTALDAFTIVVIGGTSVYGGRGAIWRTLVGVLILAVLTAFFNFLALEGAWQQLAKGVVLIGAVALDALHHRSARR
jgi:ribose transport system permease protein